MLKSKIGTAAALVVLVVIAIAFTSGGVSSFRDSTGLGDANSVATVGNQSIGTAELTLGVNRALQRVQQQQPTATMKLLVAQGGVEQVLSDLIDRMAFYVFGKNHDIAVSDRLIDSEIAQIPAFQGVDGKFSQTTFRQALAQQGISEKSLRDDIAHDMTVQQLIAPTTIGATMPEYAAKQYASLLTETRSGSIAALPSMLFAPDKDPTDKQVADFYKAHTNEFIRPERRVIRYATFGQDAVKAPPAPTDAEIAARYEANKASYGPQDNRKITQVIVPSEADAKAIVAEVSGGKSLEAAAKEKGLTAADLDFLSKSDLSSQYSSDVADAAFAAPVGKLAAPAKGPLGWHVIRVDQEQKQPARTLADVKDELSKQIAVEKSRKAFTDLLANIEDSFDNGSSLSEVAKANGLTVQTTAPVTADGQVYGKVNETVPDTLKPVLATAFSMDQEKPQVAPIVPGQTYAIFDVSEITASAPAPLKEITDDVKAAWKLDAGSQAAKAAAIKARAEISKGKTVEQALAEIGKTLPPVQKVSMSRPMLTAALQSGKQIPAPISLLFHMAANTVKVQQGPQDRAWFIVKLDTVDPGKVESDDMIKGAQRELGQQVGQAYGDALAHAIRDEVGVKEHGKAIAAMRDKLTGTDTGTTN